MTHYQKRRFERGNMQGLGIWVFLLFAVGTYFLYMFLPPWYNSWRAKNIIKSTLSGNSINGMDEDKMKDRIVSEIKEKVKIQLNRSKIKLEIRKQANMVRVQADWNPKVYYPFTKKFIKMKFHIKASMKMSL
jgi:hypothetical protein